MYFQLKTILALVVGVSLWLSPKMAFSTNYYLDSELGNDAYSGTRQNPGSGNQGPWKTVSATLGFPFLPGDSILFKKGGIWSGVRLKVSQSGDAGAVIYYGSYGKGEGKPTLEEAEINIDASFIVVENFISRNSPKEGIERKTGTHIVIRNCEIYNATANGIRIIGYWNEGLEDVLVEGCYVENSGIDNITIHKGASYAEAGHGFVLRNNRCVGAGEEGYDLTTGSDILLENNTSENNSDGSIYCGMGVKGVTVRRHHSVNDRFAIMMKACRNIRIEYSIFVGDYRLLRMDQNPDLGAPANVEFYNNIFWETGSYELARLKYTDGDITLKNNVFGGSSTNPFFYFENAETPAENGNFTFANNLYFPTNGDGNPRLADVNGSTILFDQFQENFGQEEGGLIENPGFPNYSGTYFQINDFKIAEGSFLVDKGVEVGAAVDFFGNPVPQGGIPDIGAIEVMAEEFLPVEWADFEAELDPYRPYVNVTWTTSMELNNEYFTVERSFDQHIFESIGRVESQGGGNELRNYKLVDTSPQTGKIYYRIKQTDLDGEFSYSPVLQVEFSKKKDRLINFYPSLALPGQKLTIEHGQVASSAIDIRLMDLHGRLISQTRHISQGFQSFFDIPVGLPSGYYVLTVAVEDSYKGFRVKVE